MSKKYIDRVFLNKSIDKGSYLSTLPIVKHLIKNKDIFLKSNITFFIGENGTGKSTLLEAIAIAYGLNPEGGSKNFNFHTQETHSELHKYLTLSKSSYAKDSFFLRAESFYNVASNIEEMGRDLLKSYGGESLHKQSHGESFLAVIQHRFRGNGLYILDEPEATLSPSRLLALIIEINNLVKDNSQFIIATHSPMLITIPNAQIYQFTKNGIESVCYHETEHYQLTRRFLENPERMLTYLLEE